MKICKLEAKKGTKVQDFINILDTDVKMPVTLINGEREGKTILITSGIHGAEYPAIKTAIELAKEINPSEVSGKIIIVHPVNLEGFEQRKAAIMPRDGKNLNRVFPGDLKGSISDKIAYVITHEFQDKADFYFDIHGGDVFEDLFPYVYYPGVASEEVIKISRDIAKTLNVKYMVKSSATTGSYNSAAIRGVPSILIERGSLGRCEAEDVNNYKKDMLNALAVLGVLDRKVEENKEEPKEIENVMYIDSEYKGCWTYFVKAGDLINKGQKIGEITDYFGNILCTYYAEFSGIMLYNTVSLAVDKGTSLVAYGKI